MSTNNSITLIGHIGQIDSFAKGVTISVATKQSWQKDGEWQERTEWHRIVRFGMAAEDIANGKFSVGDKVHVTGLSRTRQYESEGGKRFITEIHADTIRKVPGKGNAFSQITLVGRVGKVDPNDDRVIFTVATTEAWKDQADEWKEKTDWHRVVTFKQNSDKARKLSPGDLVVVTGEQRYRKYEADGHDVYITEIHPTSYTKIGGKHDSSDYQPGKPADKADADHDPFADFDDDMPF